MLVRTESSINFRAEVVGHSEMDIYTGEINLMLISENLNLQKLFSFRVINLPLSSHPPNVTILKDGKFFAEMGENYMIGPESHLSAESELPYGILANTIKAGILLLEESEETKNPEEGNFLPVIDGGDTVSFYVDFEVLDEKTAGIIFKAFSRDSLKLASAGPL